MMINYKLIKWGLGLALSLGLTACNWDMQRSQQRDYHYEPVHPQQKVVQQHKAKPVQKTYATKDPASQVTPGPVRKAAPQLPVIQ